MTSFRNGEHFYILVKGLARCGDHVVDEYYSRSDGRLRCPLCSGDVAVLTVNDYLTLHNSRMLQRTGDEVV